jgi:hypothetical protein
LVERTAASAAQDVSVSIAELKAPAIDVWNSHQPLLIAAGRHVGSTG